MALLVPHYIGQSIINGIGLFAKAPIAKGTVVWKFILGFDQKFHLSEIRDFPPEIIAFLRIYSHYEESDPDYLYLCSDNGRFVNHHDHANTIEDGWEYTIANQDIAAGEEITSDYSTFSSRYDDPQSYETEVEAILAAYEQGKISRPA